MARPVPEASLEESTERSAGAGERFDSMASGETLHKPSTVSLGGLSGEHLAPLPEGRYQFDEKDPKALLGRGGQGTVWKAYDAVLRREVALKRLHNEAVKDPAIVAAFLREARLTALLVHPGIVPIHDVGRDPNDGALYIALGLISGKSLASALDDAAGLDARLALVPALVRACQAVAFAHERGVVHRDLKPQNIMLGRFGETFVVDWGLALIESRQGAPDVTAPNQATGVVGTPAYMSPEQALGLAADARSDVWGLGACLYQLLTGDPPITGRSLNSAMGHAARSELAPVVSLEPGAPRDLAAICEKALSAERAGRYANAGELARDLEAWLAGRTVSARSYSRGELLRRALAANKRAVGVTALVLVALGAVLTVDELRIRRERNEARAFVRELIVDLPKRIDASRANIELINTLAERTQRWLSRVDLTAEERLEACTIFDWLARLHADVSAWDDARRASTRGLALGEQGLALDPGDARSMACVIDSLASLAYTEVEGGDAKKGVAVFEAARARFAAWKGPVTTELRLAMGGVGVRHGNWIWIHEPEAGRRYFIEAAEYVAPVFDDPNPEHRSLAMRRSTNALAAYWSLGRREEAAALGRRLAEVARPSCADPSVAAQRECLLGVGTYASLARWIGDPEADELERITLAADDFVGARDVDSRSAIYDSMAVRLEFGQFEEAARRGRRLRELGEIEWGRDMGALAAALGGDMAELEAWAPHLEDPSTAGHLALALREVHFGRYREAAAIVRRSGQARLWNAISWPARGRPALQVPDAARPALERFFETFGKAYGAANDAEMGAALDAFAAELEAL